QAVDSGNSNVWSFAHLSTCYERLGDLRRALCCLHRGVNTFPGDNHLRREFNRIAERFFAREWQLAVSVGMLGSYHESQHRLRQACSLLSSLIKIEEPLPTRPIHSMAIVAVDITPQCQLYRVEQKAEHLQAAGYDVTVYNGDGHLTRFYNDIYRFD